MIFTDYFKAPPTPQNGATNSVISGIKFPFQYSNIDLNHPSVKTGTHSQTSKYFSGDSIYFEDTNLMSSFDNK